MVLHYDIFQSDDIPLEIKSSGGCQNASGVSAVSCWELPECGQFPV